MKLKTIETAKKIVKSFLKSFQLHKIYAKKIEETKTNNSEHKNLINKQITPLP